MNTQTTDRFLARSLGAPALLALVMVSGPMDASAQTALNTRLAKGRVLALLTDNSRFGTCMAQLETFVPAGMNCAGKYVSFDCEGAFNDRVSAKQMFEMATMAYALDEQVLVEYTDTQKAGAYCIVKRTDLVRE